ncbi:MAG: hydroxyacid dehydrogenase, partial [Proteobacteria bacterium]|nr:hydroxyacid dehydrogenase [Pseudomonadota bacterium]
SVVLAGVESPVQALALYELLFERCGPRLQAFEFFTGECLGLVLETTEGVQDPFTQRYPAYVLVEFADTTDEAGLGVLLESVMDAALERELCLDAVVSSSIAQLNGLWRLREEIPEAQRVNGAHLKHDISLPIERLPEFMTAMEARLQSLCPGVRLFVFGHFGDGNLHYNLSRPLGAAEDWASTQGHELTDAVLEQVMQFGGSISAEHGIGQLKRNAFHQYKAPLDLQLMRAVKAVFDPAGIMNPGSLL